MVVTAQKIWRVKPAPRHVLILYGRSLSQTRDCGNPCNKEHDRQSLCRYSASGRDQHHHSSTSTQGLQPALFMSALYSQRSICSIPPRDFYRRPQSKIANEGRPRPPSSQTGKLFCRYNCPKQSQKLTTSRNPITQTYIFSLQFRGAI